MKKPIPLLTISFLALAASPAFAQQDLYDNGPTNGTTDAWNISSGYVVSDAVNAYLKIDGRPGASTSKQDVFAVWEFPGDVMTSVKWSYTSLANGGTVYASGTASGNNLTDQFVSSNQFGYDIDLITISGLNVTLPEGTFWLNLQDAVVPSGDPVFWDENSGVGCNGNNRTCPSEAFDSAVGTIPSEAFTIEGTRAPEPSSLMLLASGVLGLAGLLRRKLF